MALTPQQHAARYKGIGGSDAAAALGISERKTRYQLWHEKTTPPEPKIDDTEEWQEWGNLLEDPIAKMLERKEGRKIVRVRQTLVSPQFPWMLGNIDRAFVDPHVSKRVRWDHGELTTDTIAEIKNVGAFADVSQWGDEGTDEVPLSYLVQGLHYLIVTNAKTCVWGVLFGGNTFKRYRAGRRPDLIEMVIEGEREFWRMVEEKTPPPVQTLADVKLRFARDDGGTIEASPEIANALMQYRLLEVERDSMSKQLDALEVQIKAYMGDKATLTQFGVPVATWKTQKAKRTFNIDALAAEYPNLYERFAGVGKTPRVFRLKEKQG